jgi:hypothetical protein
METTQNAEDLAVEIKRRDERIARLENEVKRLRSIAESAVVSIRNLAESLAWSDNPLTDVMNEPPQMPAGWINALADDEAEARAKDMVKNFTEEYGGVTTPLRDLKPSEVRQARFAAAYGDPEGFKRQFQDTNALELTHPDIKDKTRMRAALLECVNTALGDAGYPCKCPNLKCAITALFDHGAAELLADMNAGRIPWTVKDWSELSDRTDVNRYALLSSLVLKVNGSQEIDEVNVQALCDLQNAVQVDLAKWLYYTFAVRCQLSAVLAHTGTTLP